MIQVSEFIPSYFSSTIAVSLLAASLIFIGGIRLQRTEYLTLSILGIIISVFQLSTWKYHTSVNIPDAVFWVKIQINAALVAYPIYFFTFSAWTQLEKRKIWTILVCIFALVMMVTNTFSDFSLRFSNIIELQNLPFGTGEQLAILKGEPSINRYILGALTFLLLGTLMLFVRRLFSGGDKHIAVILSLTILGQIITSIVGLMIDTGQLNFVYVAGLPVIFLIVSVCILGAYYLREQSQRYDSLHRKTTALENSISELAKGNNFPDSKAFYQHMLSSLYNLTGAEYIFIGLKDITSNKSVITTKFVLKGGKAIDNFSYDLADTPCENVFKNETCVYPKAVAEAFPEDLMLTDMKIEAYLETPLLDENGELMGILTLLHTSSLAPNSKLIEAIQIFAARAAAEIRRDRVETKQRTLAYVDYTTGLANKARSFEVINETLRSREFDGEDALLMLIDIDGFGVINHNFGYHVGEQILRELGQRLSQYQHENMFIARNGGDEFAIVFRRVSGQPRSFMNVHWEAVNAVLRKPINIESQMIQLEFSMGAVIFPQQTGRSFDVIQCAETALFES